LNEGKQETDLLKQGNGFLLFLLMVHLILRELIMGDDVIKRPVFNISEFSKRFT